MPHHPFELPFFSVAYPKIAVSTFSGEWGRYAPVTAAIVHEPSSLRSSRDSHRVHMTFSDTFNHTANQRSIGGLIVETRFYPPEVQMDGRDMPWLATFLQKMLIIISTC